MKDGLFTDYYFNTPVFKLVDQMSGCLANR